MSQEPVAAGDVRAALPRPAPGAAADPVALAPVDEVAVTTLVDNIYDALLTSEDTITRAPFAGRPSSSRGRRRVPAPGATLAPHGRRPSQARPIHAPPARDDATAQLVRQWASRTETARAPADPDPGRSAGKMAVPVRTASQCRAVPWVTRGRQHARVLPAP